MIGDCLLWGLRVIVPGLLRERILMELHQGYTGMLRIKSYVWWPGIDRDIEQFVRCCTSCNTHRDTPAVAPLHTWEYPNRPWQHL